MQQTMVDIPTEDGIADSYLVRPDGAGPFPGVLVFQDAFGLRPRLKEMAEELAVLRANQRREIAVVPKSTALVVWQPRSRR